MRTLLNIIWLVFGGIWLWLSYVLAGIVACIFIVTIPAGVASFRIARYVLWPFGRSVVVNPNAGIGSGLMNIVWFIIAGIPSRSATSRPPLGRRSLSSASHWRLRTSR